jgi:parvulin-like peptidyl-prolyl isomerase
VLVFFGLLALAGLWYCWSESGDWVVRVNGAPISAAEWQHETDRTMSSMAEFGLNPQDQSNQKIREQISDEVLRQMVEQELLRQAALRAGISASPEDVDVRVMMDMMNAGGQDNLEQALQAQGYTLGQYRRLVAEMIAVNRLEEYVTRNVTATEDEVRAAYDAEKDQLTTPEEVRVGHILVPTKAKAEAIIAKLDKGADFQKLAIANSIDPGVKEDHGTIGYITRDDPRLSEAFTDAAFNTRPGTYTRQPVRTELGWEVLFVFDKKASLQLNYADVHSQLQQQVLAHKKNEAFIAYINGLLQNGFIEHRVSALASAPKP